MQFYTHNHDTTIINSIRIYQFLKTMVMNSLIPKLILF